MRGDPKIRDSFGTEDEDSCPVCMEAYKEQHVIVLRCMHKFHSSCIRDWNVANSTCPLCRTEIFEWFLFLILRQSSLYSGLVYNVLKKFSFLFQFLRLKFCIFYKIGWSSLVWKFDYLDWKLYPKFYWIFLFVKNIQIIEFSFTFFNKILTISLFIWISRHMTWTLNL